MNRLMSRELHVSSIRLAAAFTAAAESRTFVRRTLRKWRLSCLSENAELVVSELVTNAVKETAALDQSSTQDEIDGTHIVGVQLRVGRAHLYVEVWDGGDGVPSIAEPGDDAESGRGLFLVGFVSESWGVHRSAEGGKVVWARLALDEAVDSTNHQERLPPVHSPAADEEMKRAEIAFMRRVLEGLPRLAELTSVD